MDERRVSPETPDGMLAASARAGDLDAFEELYHRYVRHVYDFLLRAVHEQAVAADLTQSTFVRAHGRLQQLRDPDRVREWLFGLAYRLAVGQLRRGPVPAAVALLPRAAGPLRGGDVATAFDDVEGADLVWRAASALAPDLYAVLDVTARQGLDVNELGQDAGLSRAEVISQVEAAHSAFGRAVRDLLVARSADWCPGLASLVQTTDMLSDDERLRVDEHLGSCPRCRPIAERLTTPATLSETPLHPLDPGLQRDGWDRLVEQLVKAAPRATRAALRIPEPPKEDTAQLVASESAMEYFAFPVPGQAAPQPETGIMRHASVRRYHAQADRSQGRRIAGWTALFLVLAALVVAAVLLNTHHPAPRTTGLTRPSTTLSPTTSTAPRSTPPSTTRPSSTTRTTVARTTTTKQTTTTTTVPLVFPPTVSSMSPTSGYPGAVVVLQGQHFTNGDLVDFTGPSLPGGTEELTPTAMSSTMIESSVPSFATFAGQHITVAVQNSTGTRSNSETFTVSYYWSGTWTKTGGKVFMQPTTLAYDSIRQGQVDLFQTDVESEQCMVDATAFVYTATATGVPIAVIPKTSTCPGQEFTIDH